MEQMQLIEQRDLRNQMIERVEVLEQVKEILTLGTTEFVTVELASKYYEVDYDTIKRIIQRHRDELDQDGLKMLSGKEVKDILVGNNLSLTNFRGYFVIEGNKFANRSNILMPKRALLRIGMLLRDSEIAKEVRTRLLDIVHDAETKTDIVDKVVEEIRTEQQICEELTKAIMNGDTERESLLKTELIGLKSKRIVELEEVIENSITIKESKAVINKYVKTIAKFKYEGIFGIAWGEFYKFANYKMGMNVNGRKGKGLGRFTDEEILELETIAKCWANELGIKVDCKLN